MTGLLLGDGSVRRPEHYKTAFASFGSIKKEMADHIADVIPLQWRRRTVPPRQKVLRGKLCRIKEFHTITSHTDLVLNGLRDGWYRNSEKIIPDDLILSPISVKYWFYGDGSTSWYDDYNYALLSFSTYCFTYAECELLSDKLQEQAGVTIRPRNTAKGPVLWTYRMRDVNAILDYMGEPDLACYKYKWKRPECR